MAHDPIKVALQAKYSQEADDGLHADGVIIHYVVISEVAMSDNTRGLNVRTDARMSRWLLEGMLNHGYELALSDPQDWEVDDEVVEDGE